MKAGIGRWLSGCVLAFAAWASAPGAAFAAACTVDLSFTALDPSVADATHCNVAAAANSSPSTSVSVLNTANPGGLNLTWSFVDRDGDSGASAEIDAALGMTGIGSSSGSWMINTDAISSTLNRFIITLKGGPLGTDFLWFVIDPTSSANACSASQDAAGWELCGTWLMYGNGHNRHAISHLDLFAAREAGITVLPEPGSVALLALVLGGIGFASRRRA